ncbi:MAG TPA: phosphatase PAP2 family protein [Gaiellaceae bacterium]
MQPRRVPVFATLLAGAACAAASLASAQRVSPPLPPVGETVQTLGTDEIAPADSESRAEVPAPFEEPPPFRPPSFPKIVLLDTAHVLTSPFHWGGREWALLSASTAAVAALSLADKSVSNAARERGPSFGFVGDQLEGLGDERSFLLLGGFYLFGAIGHDSRAKNVFVDGLSASLIASGIITPVLSTLIGRERPTSDQGAYSFHPFGGRAMPSGHATQAFAVAAVIATSYDKTWLTVAAYGAATVGAYERVRRGKHFPTDVVVGAAIGTVVGRSVVHFNQRLRSGEKEPESAGARLTFLPVVGGGTYGVSASLEF